MESPELTGIAVSGPYRTTPPDRQSTRSMTFLFAASIDNACPLDAQGRRVDQMDRSGHYARWAEDFSLIKALGVNAVRYGPAYYRTHVGPDHFDWEVVEEPMQGLEESGLTVIAELCRFGVPSWFGGFQDPAFPVLFAEYARAFAKRYPWIRHFTPVSEIFLCARMSGLDGEWNERGRSEAEFVRALRNLCMAHELAVEGILAERPDAVIVQTEGAEHAHPAGRAATARCDRWNQLKMLALDLTLGHELAPGMGGLLQDNGVASNDLTFFRERRAHGQRVLALVYHSESERRISAGGRVTSAHDGLGFARLASEYWRRYKLPLMHGGTYHPTRNGSSWLAAQWESVLSLRAAGVQMSGFGWSAFVDHITLHADDNGSAERCHSEPVGLYSLSSQPSPMAEAYGKLIRRWSPVVSGDDQLDANEIKEAGSQA
jgi:hypothetical protein